MPVIGRGWQVVLCCSCTCFHITPFNAIVVSYHRNLVPVCIERVTTLSGTILHIFLFHVFTLFATFRQSLLQSPPLEPAHGRASLITNTASSTQVHFILFCMSCMGREHGYSYIRSIDRYTCILFSSIYLSCYLIWLEIPARPHVILLSSPPAYNKSSLQSE